MAVQISGNDITVPRDGSFTRNVTIGGTLTYEDVTNIDSVGLVTARNGIEIGARPGVAASISVDGNMIVSGISTFGGAISGTTGTFTSTVNSGTTATGTIFSVGNGGASGDRVLQFKRAARSNDINIQAINSGTGATNLLFNQEGGAASFGGAISATTGTFTGDVDIADKIVHTGDTNTKIRFPSNDVISFETSGSEGARLDAGRRFLIGSTTARTSGGSAYAHLQVEGTDSPGAEILVIRNSNDSYASTLGLVKTRGTSDGAVTTVADNDKLGQIQFRGADGSDIYSVAASIHGEVDGSPSDGTDMPGALVFGTTADGSASPTERLRIDSSGRVMIGTTTNRLGEALHVLGNGIVTSSAENTNMMIFGTFNGSNALIGSFNSIPLLFRTGNTERLRIDSSGVITNSLSSDNTTAVTLRNNGTTGGHVLKVTSGGTGAGTNIFSCYRNNQSSEGLVFNIDGTGQIKIGPTSYGTTTAGMCIRPGNESTLFRDSGIVLLVGGGQSGQKLIEFRHGGNGIGSISKNGTTGTQYLTSSDYRLKENQVAISDGITRLKTLKPYRFNFIADASTTVDGFFAHEVTAVPESISGTKDEVDSDNNPVYQGIDQSKLVPLLTAALQEAVTEIESLKTRLDAAGL